MKFIKVGNTILNVSQIECVTENLVTVGYVDNDNSPFGKAVKDVCGIRVYMVGAHENSYFVFESETIESFYEKLVAA